MWTNWLPTAAVSGCTDATQKVNAPPEASVEMLLKTELDHGLQAIATYTDFQPHADRVKDDLLIFLLDSRRAGKTVAAYGAAAKGNTLLNYAGVKPDLFALRLRRCSVETEGLRQVATFQFCHHLY